MLAVQEPRVAPRQAPPPTAAFRDTPLGRTVRKAFLTCASLKLAIALLSFFTLCLAAATLLESAYSARVAQGLIYHTWWFALLLCLLAVNILCAALKKYPWKRHQTGFLITHAGLLILVFGGLLTNLGGVEGQMMMLDSENREIQHAFRLANRADTIQLVDRHQLEVYREPKDRQLAGELRDVLEAGLEIPDALRDRLTGYHWVLGLSPGAFAWKSDDHHTPDLPWTVRLLSTIANPFPGYSQSLDDTTRLIVENYYPHTERQPFSAADGDAEEDIFPALHLKLTTPMAPRPFKRWVTSLPSWENDPTPIAFELFTLFDPALLREFLEPPSPTDLGKQGQLVIAVGHPRQVVRLPLDKLKQGETIPLAGSNLKFTLRKQADLLELLGQKPQSPREDMPHYPTLQFELTSEKGTGTYLSCARMPHLTAFRDGTDVATVTTWYHYPDFRWGQANKMGALQFLKAPDGKVYYRVYGKDGLKQSGRELDTAAVHELPFKPMEMRFEVLGWLPRAVRRDHIIPRNIRPGSDPSERLEPALRCTLQSGDEEQEVWVRMSRAAVPVTVGKDTFHVRYRMDSKRVDFSLTLKQARQTNDPGTDRAAGYESEVLLTHGEEGNRTERGFTISMNNTLNHGGFKVYQTNYRPITSPQTGQMVLDTEGKLVSLSGFTLADDPGLFCKYLGSFLLVLGIATMFYMRAYFFKPHRAST